MKRVEFEALRTVGEAEKYVLHGGEHKASLAALIGATVYGHAELPSRLARGALEQLSCDLTMLAEVFDGGTDLMPDIIQKHILSLAARASAAAELAERIEEANKAEAAK